MRETTSKPMMPSMQSQPDTATVMHVLPQRRGAWIVRREGEVQTLSTHNSATEAELRALATGACAVVVHDRYGRVHTRTHSRRTPPGAESRS